MASSTTPINTVGTYLLKGTGSGTITYAKLVDIKDYPDLFGETEQLEVTTLSDTIRKYIAGLKNAGDSVNFLCNYTYSDFNTVHALDNGSPVKLRLAFGDTDGTEGYFDFEGYVSATLVGKGVNEVREFNVRVVLSTDITLGVKA